jgi:hypothetical protein
MPNKTRVSLQDFRQEIAARWAGRIKGVQSAFLLGDIGARGAKEDLREQVYSTPNQKLSSRFTASCQRSAIVATRIDDCFKNFGGQSGRHFQTLDDDGSKREVAMHVAGRIKLRVIQSKDNTTSAAPNDIY